MCKGSGFVHDVEDGHVIYSKVINCPHKGCMRDSILAYKKGECFAKQRGATDATQIFNTFKSRVGTKKVYQYAKEFADSVGSPPHYGRKDFVWLLIYGGVGNGKTHLCNAITKTVLARGCEVRMIAAADMFAEIKAGMDNKNSEEVIRKFKDVFVLVIDDLGVEYGSQWTEATFDEIMTSRFATAKPTVVTTNRDIAELSGRLRSRFGDKVMSRIVHNSALDFRKERGS